MAPGTARVLLAPAFKINAGLILGEIHVLLIFPYIPISINMFLCEAKHFNEWLTRIFKFIVRIVLLSSPSASILYLEKPAISQFCC